MRNTKSFVHLHFLFLLLLTFFASWQTQLSTVHASFEDIGAGARAIGMGNAFVSVADDFNALYYNPAGIAKVPRPEFGGSYGKLYVGLSDQANLSSGFFGAVLPTKRLGSFGFSWLNYNAALAYQEHAFALSYARKVYGDFSLGFSLKRLSVQYGQDEYTAKDPVFDYGKKDSESNMSFDFGIYTKPFQSLSFALAVSDLNQPNLGLKDKNKIPLTLRAGLGWFQRSSVVAVDGIIRDKNFSINVGGEKWFMKRTIATRIGVSLGNQNMKNLTTGFGYNLGSIQIDYSFIFPIDTISGTAGTHRGSVVIRFGPDPEIKAEQERERLRQEEIKKALQQRKEDFYNRGDQYFRAGDYDIAIMQWEEALRIDPNHKPSMEGIARAKLKKSEEKAGDERQMKEFSDLVERLTRQLEAARESAHKKETELTLREAQIKRTEYENQKLKKQIESEEKLKKAEEETKKISNRVTSYRVVSGETLQSIAVKIYGDESRWVEIYNANKDKLIRGVTQAGQVLVIP